MVGVLIPIVSMPPCRSQAFAPGGSCFQAKSTARSSFGLLAPTAARNPSRMEARAMRRGDAKESQQTGADIQFSRRQTVELALASTITALSAQHARAAYAGGGSSDPRQHLLELIKAGKGDEGVIPAIRTLSETNPTPNAADPKVLEGRWKLLWASDKSEVSIATRKIPGPLRASSVQLIGAKGGSEDGRAANWIQLLGGAVTIKLSAAAVPDEEANDTVLIGPPFYFGLSLGGLTIPIQDTQPGGGRKSILGNEQNYYKQLYVENTGKPGDLRLSEVVRGDSAVTGSVFVHERL